MSKNIIIFGASGDLAKLKIFPAVFDLYKNKVADDETTIIGYARSQMDNSAFRENVSKSILNAQPQADPSLIKSVVDKFNYISGQYDQANDIAQIFDLIKTRSTGGKPEVIAYFSVPPNIFGILIKLLAVHNQDFNLKIVIEKPFGTDMQTAKELYLTISDNFRDEQVYLLDHYLGKNPVRELVWLKQNNAILNTIIKGEFIKSIQISALETLGVEDRLGYYNQVGSTRDMVQSHLLQVLALICMDLPMNSERVPQEKEHILACVEFDPARDKVLFGQYDDYQQQSDEVKNSTTETWTAVRLHLDRLDWQHVPIYIRTGKKMSRKWGGVVIEFKNLPTQIDPGSTNKLTFEFNPDQTITFQLNHIRSTTSLIQEPLSEIVSMSDYAQLLRDVIQSNHLHFVSFRQIIESWRIVDSILEYKQTNPESLKTYTSLKPVKFEDEIFESSDERWL
ncbi:MAG: glucose-6-phosphate dehydrogenase [Patescibacteria group bacterium]